ncbi:hypothetical protein KY320_01270 [Candidatus Woesearchaeota archaeon]|nr:hypothetical protein [Candidatus Woesearchaeota archaeon]
MKLKELFEFNSFKAFLIMYLLFGHGLVGTVISSVYWDFTGIEFFLFPWSVIMLIGGITIFKTNTILSTSYVALFTLLIIIVFDYCRRSFPERLFTAMIVVVHMMAVILSFYQWFAPMLLLS